MSGIFRSAMRQVKLQLRTVAVFSLATNLLLLASSIYMLQVFDRVLSSGSLDTLFWLTVAAMVAIAAYGLLEHARRRILAKAGAWTEMKLSAPVIRRVIDSRLAGIKSKAGLSDLSDLKAFISGEAILAFLDAPFMPLFILVIWLIHPALGMLALGGAFFLFTLAIANDFFTHAGARNAAAKNKGLHSLAQRTMDQAETVRSLGMTGNLLRTWQERQKEVHGLTHQAQDVTEGFANVTRASRLALQVLILGVGAYLVLQGNLTSGGMIAASIILSRALSPVERALTAWRTWSAARIATRNLRELFDTLPERSEPMVLPPPTGRIDIEALRYETAGVNEPILKRIDLALEAGRTCGIIGPSGSGKSSLCRLIVGAWGPSAGHVRLDGADISRWDPDLLGRHIGYLPQQVDLLPGTIAQNIARMGNVDSQAVTKAAQLADVHEMILRLPAGYDTEVGAGAALSGGQRQRIGLARALYGDPVLIVLDEPNSNLDHAGELALRRTLERLKELERTVFIVAHHPSALRSADRVLLIRDGMVAAFGERDEVLRAVSTSATGVVPLQTGTDPAARGRHTRSDIPVRASFVRPRRASSAVPGSTAGADQGQAERKIAAQPDAAE